MYKLVVGENEPHEYQQHRVSSVDWRDFVDVGAWIVYTQSEVNEKARKRALAVEYGYGHASSRIVPQYDDDTIINVHHEDFCDEACHWKPDNKHFELRRNDHRSPLNDGAYKFGAKWAEENDMPVQGQKRECLGCGGCVIGNTCDEFFIQDEAEMTDPNDMLNKNDVIMAVYAGVKQTITPKPETDAQRAQRGECKIGRIRAPHLGQEVDRKRARRERRRRRQLPSQVWYERLHNNMGATEHYTNRELRRHNQFSADLAELVSTRRD